MRYINWLSFSDDRADDCVLSSAHKAAHPDKYPVKPQARMLYPALNGIEQRYGPTKVHLQVYDGTLYNC